MKLSNIVLALGILSNHGVLSKYVTVTDTDSTVYVTKETTKSVTTETVYNSDPTTVTVSGLQRHSATTDDGSSFEDAITSSSTYTPTTLVTLLVSSSSTEAISLSSTLVVSSENPTVPHATVLSSASTSTSTIFSNTESSVSSVTGSINSSFQIVPTTSIDITTTSVSQSVTIDTSTLTEATTLTTSSLSSSSSALSSAPSSASLAPIISTSAYIQLVSSYAKYSNSSSSLVTYYITSSEIVTVAKSSSSSSSSTTTTTSSTALTSTSSPSIASTSSTIDLFNVISTDAPPSVFARDELPLEILSGVSNDEVPYQTNKFFENLILGDQTDTAFYYPYSGFYIIDEYYGFAIAHTTSSQYAFGGSTGSDSYEYYINPVGIASMIFSATDLTSSNINLEVTEMRDTSVLVTLTDGTDSNYIDIPLVIGMGMNTAIYNGDLIPEINSAVGFSSLTTETSKALASGILKYRATLYNGVEWLIYVILPEGYSTSDFELSADSTYSIKGNVAIDDLIIQIAVAPSSTDLEAYYDESAGMYATTMSVEGSYVEAENGIATYSFNYQTSGSSASGDIIIFALPHHVDSLSAETSSHATGISLDSTTKGVMYAFLTNSLIMEETLTTDVQFLPYSADMTSDLSYTADQLQIIASAANDELAVDIAALVAGQSSNYYCGKVIDKYAYILLTVSDIIGDSDVTASALEQLKEAFETLLTNTQVYPLMYDTRYGGLTSSASQGGDTGADFGAAYYNDHHFHYGYMIHAAAIVGYIDAKAGGTWAQDNKEWVNSLIRDVANPSLDDTYFPVSRMFDWFAGHSWAAGLFDFADGRDQESSSEDYNFSYGMKLWGKVIGDKSMEYRGDLMLAIQNRAMNMYYLYSSDNTVQPSTIIPNKVAGILWDNKIDYTTWFGTNTEYIHGIHMMPITPASGLIRGSTFVEEEWNAKLSTLAPTLTSGWASVLRINEALFNPSDSYNFYTSSSWSDDYLDDGQSRTWGLAFSAGLLNTI